MTGDPNQAPNSPAGEHAHAHGEEEMVCYCFHVPLHKIVNFIRRERPAKVSMISHCLGAGTGCGTCVWDIKDIWKKTMAECAAEDAKNGVTRAPASAPPAPPLPPTGLASDFFRRHSPAVDRGPVMAPQVVPSPPYVLPSTPAPAAVNTPAAPPTMPLSAESADIDYDHEFEPEADAPAPVKPAAPHKPPASEDPRP